MGLFSKIFGSYKASNIKLPDTPIPPTPEDNRTPFQIEITRICNILAQAACNPRRDIVVPNEIKNKDKLVLVVTVQTPRCMEKRRSVEFFGSAKHYFENEFNDGTVLVMMVPFTDNTDTFKVDVKQLNTSKMSPEQLDKVLLRANEVVEKFVNGLK